MRDRELPRTPTTNPALSAGLLLAGLVAVLPVSAQTGASVGDIDAGTFATLETLAQRWNDNRNAGDGEALAGMFAGAERDAARLFYRHEQPGRARAEIASIRQDVKGRFHVTVVRSWGGAAPGTSVWVLTAEQSQNNWHLVLDGTALESKLLEVAAERGWPLAAEPATLVTLDSTITVHAPASAREPVEATPTNTADAALTGLPAATVTRAASVAAQPATPPVSRGTDAPAMIASADTATAARPARIETAHAEHPIATASPTAPIPALPVTPPQPLADFSPAASAMASLSLGEALTDVLTQPATDKLKDALLAAARARPPVPEAPEKVVEPAPVVAPVTPAAVATPAEPPRPLAEYPIVADSMAGLSIDQALTGVLTEPVTGELKDALLAAARARPPVHTEPAPAQTEAAVATTAATTVAAAAPGASPSHESAAEPPRPLAEFPVVADSMAGLSLGTALNDVLTEPVTGELKDALLDAARARPPVATSASPESTRADAPEPLADYPEVADAVASLALHDELNNVLSEPATIELKDALLESARARPPAPEAVTEQPTALSRRLVVADARDIPVEREVTRFENWSRVCVPADGDAKPVCRLETALVDADTRKTVFAWQLGYAPDGRLLSVTRIPNAVVLSAGLELALSESRATQLPVGTCVEDRCESAFFLSEDLVDALETRDAVSGRFQRLEGDSVEFTVSMQGFSTGLASLR